MSENQPPGKMRPGAFAYPSTKVGYYFYRKKDFVRSKKFLYHITQIRSNPTELEKSQV